MRFMLHNLSTTPIGHPVEKWQVGSWLGCQAQGMSGGPSQPRPTGKKTHAEPNSEARGGQMRLLQYMLHFVLGWRPLLNDSAGVSGTNKMRLS